MLTPSPFPVCFVLGLWWLFVRPLNHVCLFCHLMNCGKTPLSMEYSRQEYQNGLPFPSSGVSSDQVNYASPALLRQILLPLAGHLGRPGFVVDRKTLIFPDTTGLLAHLPSLMRKFAKKNLMASVSKKPIFETNECI